MPYNYTIVDADASSKLQLQHFLEDYGDFACLDEARDRNAGLNSIIKYLPDIVFINLGEKAYEYFHMVTELYQYMKELPIFIGISRTKEYAYDAIKYNFFDYWLLPYNEFDVRKTIRRLQKQLPVEEGTPTLCLKSYKDYHYIDTNDILYLKADSNTTDFHLKDGRVISAFKTLKTYENQLPKNFIRVHQSYILNRNYVSRINYGKSVCALKSGKTQLPFSRSYRPRIDELKKILSRNSISTSK
ncbi:MAG: LytTR family DNA-binding domain-containing protein [Eudoraea sp.]|nr:LytTR family DNA-binding domain-containing protein [Eudoraea sp.]NNK29993.1 response regulator transcription factor [Flavobacteriaceae bacterium]